MLNEKYELLGDHNKIYNDRLQAALKSKFACGLKQATGTGKTYHILQTIYDIGLIKNPLKVLIIVPGDALRVEWTGALLDDSAPDADKYNLKFQKALAGAGQLRTSVKERKSHFSLAGGREINLDFDIQTLQAITTLLKFKKGEEVTQLSKEQENILDNLINPYNLIVFDEFHCIGENKRGPIAEYIISKANSSRYVIGMTATDKRFDGKTMDNYFPVVIQGPTESQAEEGTYEVPKEDGSISTDNSPIIPKIKWIKGMVYMPELSTSRLYFSNLEENIRSFTSGKTKEDLLLKVDQIKDLATLSNFKKEANSFLLSKKPQKILVFYQRGETDKAIKLFIKKVFGINNILSATGSSKDDLQKSLKEFNDEEKKDIALVSIDRIVAGIHPKGVTAIVLLRKTFSETTFGQQIGRARDFGNRGLTIPVFDIVNNTDSKISMDQKDYEENFKSGGVVELPSFTKIKKLYTSIMKTVEVNSTKAPKAIKSNGDLKDTIYNSVSTSSIFSDGIRTLSDFSYHSIKELFLSCIQDKIAKGLIQIPIDYFEDRFIKQAIIYKGKKQYKSDYSLLYRILDAYTTKNGKFEDYDSLRDFCTITLGLSKTSLTKEFLKSKHPCDYRYFTKDRGKKKLSESIDLYTEAILKGESIREVLSR